MFTNALSRRKAAVACVAVSMSSIRALGQTPEDESRLLAAAVAPKIKDVEESSLTVEFITGPNLVSYDFTVDCYARQEVDGELVPLTSCSDAEDSTETPVSQSGETGKALSKVDVVVSPLLGGEVYDCFLYTEGPNGYEKCKYVGSSDIACTSATPLDVSGATVSTAGPTPEIDIPVTTETLPGLGNPALDTTAVFPVGCVLGADGVCPFVADPATTTDNTYAELVTLAANSPPLNSFAVPVDTDNVAIAYNTVYTCFGVAPDQCGDAGAVTCSDPVEVTTPFAVQTATATTCTTTSAGGTWSVPQGGDAIDFSASGVADAFVACSVPSGWANGAAIPPGAWNAGSGSCAVVDNAPNWDIDCTGFTIFPAPGGAYTEAQCWLGIAYNCDADAVIQFDANNEFSGSGCDYGYVVSAPAELACSD